MSQRQLHSRRSFLAASAVASSSLLLPPALRASERIGASERVNVGVVGCGVRGKYLIANLPPTARVVALCDCSLDRMAGTLEPRSEPFSKILAGFRDGDARRCRTYQDYRQLFDHKPLDAVIIATPDHHHVLAATLACQAGLDVYLEKPLSVTISEGRVLADVVRHSGRVLQVGSQQRTMEMNRCGCEFVRDGGLGRISLVELPNYPGPLRYEPLGEERVPAGLDWELFCGPAPLRPHHRRLWVKEEFEVGGLLWRGWDLWRDYSGHLMTNWGAHSIDMVQYALGMDDSGPVEVGLSGDVTEDDLHSDWLAKWGAKTPRPRGPWLQASRFQPVRMRYATGTELRFVPGIDEAIFHGERGRLWMSRNKFRTDPPGLVTGLPDADAIARWSGDGHVARPHLENWLQCIASRGTPNAPIEVGHRTVTVCHLANIARELGRELRWDPTAEQFVADDEANGLLIRPRRDGFTLPVVA